MSVEKEVSADGCEVTIRVSGRFDLCLDAPFREAYLSEDLTAKKVYIDLSRTDEMDGTALGMLLMLRKHAGGSSSIVSLVGCAPTIAESLKAARFETLFHIAA